MKRYSTVDEFIIGHDHWQESLILLRELLLSTGLEESIKWGTPVFTFSGKNVAGMAGFKSYAGIWYYQGALLKDARKKLITADEGSARAMRQWRFSSREEIEASAGLIVEYTLEAIENVKAGKEIKPQKNKPLIIPVELEEQFRIRPGLRNSFESLSLTQKREHCAFIGNARRPETRQKRLEKSIPMILQGIGVMDKYR